LPLGKKVFFQKKVNQSNNVAGVNVELVATSKQPHINIKQKRLLSKQQFLNFNLNIFGEYSLIQHLSFHSIWQYVRIIVLIQVLNVVMGYLA